MNKLGFVLAGLFGVLVTACEWKKREIVSDDELARRREHMEELLADWNKSAEGIESRIFIDPPEITLKKIDVATNNHALYRRAFREYDEAMLEKVQHDIAILKSKQPQPKQKLRMLRGVETYLKQQLERSPKEEQLTLEYYESLRDLAKKRQN